MNGVRILVLYPPGTATQPREAIGRRLAVADVVDPDDDDVVLIWRRLLDDGTPLHQVVTTGIYTNITEGQLIAVIEDLTGLP